MTMASVSDSSGNAEGPQQHQLQSESGSQVPTMESKSDYIRTGTQSYVSRSASVLGAPNLTTKGKSVVRADVTIRGDYGAPIHIGRYCHIERGAALTPSVVPVSSDPLLAIAAYRSSAGGDDTPPGKNEKALPIIIGSHTRVGPKSQIQSLSIGSCVRVGSNCILAPRSKVHDCCIIEDGTVLPPDMVVPPFSRVRGCPGKIVGTLPECCGGEFVEDCVQDYLHFVKSLDN